MRRFVYEKAARRGFTLAEVLITVAVIGVVAALVLPNLIGKYKLLILEVQFKQAWVIMNDVLNKAVKDESLTGLFANMDKRNSGASLILSAVERDAINQVISRYFVGTHRYEGTQKLSYYGFEGRDFCSAANLIREIADGAIVTRSGLTYNAGLIWEIRDEATMVRIFFDTNGLQKGPNRHGYDKFCLDLNLRLREVTYCSASVPSRALEYRESANYCYNSLDGENCAYFALKDIHPGGMYNSNKTKQRYWKNLTLQLK